MYNIKFNKVVGVNDLVNYLNNNFVGGCSVEEFNKGSGVYSVMIGSRGELEEIIFDGNKNKLMDDFDIIKEYYDGEESNLDMVGSGEVDWNDFGGYYELYGEESSVEYYNVVV